MKTAPLLSVAVTTLACCYLPVHAQVIVNFGTASTFAVLGASTVTNTGLTVVTGDLGTSPGTAITGFGPGIVHGTIYSAGAVALQAQADALTAYNSLASQTATTSGATTFGTTTLTSGVYNAPTSLGLTGTLSLDAGGDAQAVFVFQTGSTLTFAVGSQVLLTNGARAENVHWQVGSSATLGTSASVVGNILANQSISLGTGATVDGRLFALNAAVTLLGNTVSIPSGAIPEPATTVLLVSVVALGLATWRRHHAVRTSS